MKKINRILGLFFAIILMINILLTANITYAAGSDIEINSANFPDDIFRSFVSRYDTDTSGTFSPEEIAAVNKMEPKGLGIKDFKGLEYFTELTKFDGYNNILTSGKIDFSSNKKLVEIFMSYNGLTDINISSCTELQHLYLANNKLTALDLSKNTKLTNLNVSTNLLETLDISKCTQLEDIDMSSNNIKYVDFSNNSKLKVLYLSDTEIENLDLSECKLLNNFFIKNTPLNNIKLSGEAPRYLLDIDFKTFKKFKEIFTVEYSFKHIVMLDMQIGIRDYIDLNEILLINDSNPITSLHGATIENGVLKNFTRTSIDFYYNQNSYYNPIYFDILWESSLDINKQNFPDNSFRKYLKQFDQNADGVLNKTELNSINSFDFTGLSIADFTGFEEFLKINSVKDSLTVNCDRIVILPSYVNSSSITSLIGASLKNGIMTADEDATKIKFRAGNVDYTFSITIQQHNWNNEYEADKTTHYLTCLDCNIVKSDSRKAHNGGTATCTEKAKCSVCDEEYGDPVDHKYKWVIDKKPTASETGLKHEECSVCKDKRNINTVISETKSPQTGDNSNTALMYALLLIAGMGLTATTIYGIKKEQIE